MSTISHTAPGLGGQGGHDQRAPLVVRWGAPRPGLRWAPWSQQRHWSLALPAARAARRRRNAGLGGLNPVLINVLVQFSGMWVMAGEWHFVSIHSDNLGMLLGGWCRLEKMFLSVSEVSRPPGSLWTRMARLSLCFHCLHRKGLLSGWWCSQGASQRGRLSQSWVPFLRLLHQSQPGRQQESSAKGQSVCPSVSFSWRWEENAVLFLDGVPISAPRWLPMSKMHLVQAPLGYLQPSGSCMFLRPSVLRGPSACFVSMFLS